MYILEKFIGNEHENPFFHQFSKPVHLTGNDIHRTWMNKDTEKNVLWLLWHSYKTVISMILLSFYK